MKKAYLLLLILLNFSLSYGQYTYIEADSSVTVSVNDTIIDAPFSGGYNAPQINEFDLNQDGIMDMIIYDRSEGQVRTYINRGIADSVSFHYAPQYASQFPSLRQFLRTADFNNDGKMDLFDGGSNIQVWENISNTIDGLQFQLKTKLLSTFNPGSPVRFEINPNTLSLPGIYDIDKDGDIDIFTFNSNGQSLDYHRDLSQERGSSEPFDYERRNTCWGNFLEGGFSSSIFLDTCRGPIPPDGELKVPYRKDISTSLSFNRSVNQKSIKHSGSMVSPVDIDNNGSMDLLISDVSGYQLKLLENDDTSSRDSHISSFSDSFPNYDKPVDLLFPAAFFLDINNDGFKDMVAAPNIFNQSSALSFLGRDDIYYYENIATDSSYLFQFRNSSFLKDQTLDFGLDCHPLFFDYNKDGLMDLLVGNDGYVDSTLKEFIGQLALFENTGTKKDPTFKLIDLNYLQIPSLKLDYVEDKAVRGLIPTVGDLDDDGDMDMLLGVGTNDIFFFEDTALNGQAATFKFHPEPFQGVHFPRRANSHAPVLYDINGDSLLDLITSGVGPIVKYFINFGTKVNPIFNIKLDSIIYQQGKTFRYYLNDVPNYTMFKVDDTLAVNAGSNLNNNSFIPLILTAINSTDHYFECTTTLSGPIDEQLNDTSGFINFFDRNWGHLFSSISILRDPSVFPYRNSNGETQLIIGDAQGPSYFFNEVGDSLLNGRDTFNLLISDFLLDYGKNPTITGADINDDGKIDLAIGNEAGGLKLLFGDELIVGLNETADLKEGKQAFSIYPNPTNDLFTIRLNDKVNTPVKLKIIDVNGKIIRQENLLTQSTQFNLTGLSNGVYLIKIEGDDFNETSKIILRP